MLSDYQQQLRDRFLAAPVTPPPPPWRLVLDASTPIGGLQGVGFATHPVSENDLVMAVSTDGHGLFDAVTGDKSARDHRVLLSTGGGLRRGPAGEDWWHIFHADYSEFRAAGFSVLTG